MQIHEFHADLDRSKAVSNEAWEAFYRSIWPDLLGTWQVPDNNDWQLAGVDRVLFLPGLRTIKVDEKIRFTSYDDFLCERWSNAEEQRLGWTIDPAKVTDYVAYYIRPISKVYLLPFDLLRLTCQNRLHKWDTPERRRLARNKNHTTTNLIIKWPELWAAMYTAGTIDMLEEM